MKQTATIIAAVLATPATTAHSEEPPPLMQPRSPETASEDRGPMWVATSKITCGKYQGIVWAGVNGAKSFTRFYGKGVEREGKNFEVRDGEHYYKGKRCKTED